MKLEKGQVQVYTGNGKGKTTAALGLALRATGREMRVCIIQFMKGGGPYGEHLAAEKLAPYLTIIPTGREGWVNKENPDPEDIRLAREALKLAAETLTGGNYDLVILDEINGAVFFLYVSSLILTTAGLSSSLCTSFPEQTSQTPFFFGGMFFAW